MQQNEDAVCMPNEISIPDLPLFSALGPIDHCHGVSAGSPLKKSLILLFALQIPSRAENSF